jgi:cytochrome d ubiquinol oxidase subunit II
VAFANFVRGLPIDANMMYTGGFWNLLNWYALLGGLVSLTGFTLYGAIFLSLKTTDDLQTASEKIAWKLWIPNLVIMLTFIVASFLTTDFVERLGINPGPIPIGAGLALLVAGYFIRTKRTGWAFVMMVLTIIFSIATIYLQLFPRVMVSSLNPEWSLTIYNASSSPYTLRIMTIVALIFTPIVLVYQGWTYWVFRKRVSVKSPLHY